MTNPLMKTKIEIDIPLAGKTTLKLGGNAAFYLQPENSEDIADCVAWAGERRLPVFTLGNGSNVLVSDKGWPGLVIDVGARFDRIDWTDSDAVCLSGASLNRLVREMLERKYRGLEMLGGIPGTVGGALFMNAGAYGQSIAECVVSVDYYDPAERSAKTLSKEGLKAEYRRTVFASLQAIILCGRFRFQQDTSGKAREIHNDCLLKRRHKHPLDLPNCGSVFKNPKPQSAGMLIESCGLKGYGIGGVEVSAKHANFIVNRGKGTAADARRLIAHVQKTVYEKQGVLLEPEVVFVGEFDEPLFTV
jgi:UDP-N-acetylmuramate dehydrogenase